MALLRSFLPFEEKKADSFLHMVALLAFAGSVYVGIHQAGPMITLPFLLLDVYVVTTLLWIGLGLAALVLLRETVEDVWTDGIWLVGCYIIAGLGAVMLTVAAKESFWWWVVGLVLVALGILLLLNLWLTFYTNRRMLIRANPEIDPATFTLGTWNILIPFFVLFTLGTYYFWSKWYLGESTPIFDSIDPLNLYLLLDLLVFGLAIYMLYIPQRNLGRYYIREVEPVGDGEGLFGTGGGLSRKATRELASCQSCEAETRLEQRSCPSCSRATTFGWCPKCEHYSVTCTDCGAAAVGGGTCSSCETDLTKYTCPNCGNASPLRSWASN